MRVDGPVGDDGIAPGLVENLIPRYDLAPALDKKLEQLEFQGRKMEFFARSRSLMALEIDRDIAEFENIIRLLSLSRSP